MIEPLETARLCLRPTVDQDAAFLLELMNQPSWLRFIGDRGIHSLEDAHRHGVEEPRRMQEQEGCGLLLVETRDERVPVGLCGLLKRDALPDPDLGFAILERFHRRGYAAEAARAVLADARGRRSLRRVLALTLPQNTASVRLLEGLGFHRESSVRLSASGDELELYALDLSPRRGTSTAEP